MTDAKNTEQAGFEKNDDMKKSDDQRLNSVTADEMEKVAGGDQSNAQSLDDVTWASW